jgi:hypothetical protein
VLASPPLTAADLGDGADKSVLGAADRAAILAAAEALSAALSKGGAEGLVTYSGHGVVAGHSAQEIEGADLAICPEDVARQPDGSFDRVIRFGELAEVFTRHGVRDALTIFLDTCYSGSGDADAPPARHLLGNQASPLAASVTKALAAEADAVMASRLILGARHWKPAYEVRTGSGYRGAASFAMTTLLEQWSTKSADGVTYFNVSYGDLIHRARRVIEALGFDQQPFMWGQRELDDLPVLKHGLAVTPGETSEAPDGHKDSREIPVDARLAGVLVMTVGTMSVLTCVATGNLPAGSLPEGMASNNEYFFGYNVGQVNWTAGTTTAGLMVMWSYDTRFMIANGTHSGTGWVKLPATLQAPTWTEFSASTASGTTAMLFLDTTNTWGVYLVYTNASGSLQFKSVQFCLCAATAPVSGTSAFGVVPAGNAYTLTLQSAPPSVTGKKWYLSTAAAAS